MVTPATYIVYKQASNFYAVDGITGNILTFNADAATVINAAISATYAMGGGIVHIKSGVYEISTPVVMISKVVLEGENASGLGIGNENTLLKLADGANCDVITSYNALSQLTYNVCVKNISIDGNKENQTVGGLNGIGWSATESLIDRVLVRNVKGRGINWQLLEEQNCIYGFVDDSRISDCDGAAVVFNYWTVNMRLTRSVIERCGKVDGESAIISKGPYNYIKDNLQIYECYRGVEVVGNNSGVGAFIINNQIELIQREGVLIEQSPDCIVQGNGFMQCSQETDNTYSSIKLNDTSGNIISGNRFRKLDPNNDTSKYPKYSIEGVDADYNLITGNDFRSGATTDAIEIDGNNNEIDANID